MAKRKKYKETGCPFCNAKIKIYKKVGKVTCPSCQETFYVGYDKLKHAWVSIDPESPIQAVFIRGVKKDEKGK